MKIREIPKEARKDYYKKIMLGSNDRRGLIMTFVVYLLLITIAFIYLYPVLYMFSRSLMDKRDLLDSSAKWIPSSITLSNYKQAIDTMDYWNSLLKNLVIALTATVCQVFITSWVGYGFARYNFPGKLMWMGLLILSFLLPAQTIAVPNFLLFNSDIPLFFKNTFGIEMQIIDGTVTTDVTGQAPYAIAGVKLAGGASKTYQVRVTYTVDQTAVTDWASVGTCDAADTTPDKAKGLYNLVTMDSDSDGVANNDACVPVMLSTMRRTSA